MIKILGIKMQIFLHIAAWAILLGIPIFFFYRWDVPKGFIWAFYIYSLINGVIFYSNYLVLIPKMFFKERILRYILAALLLAVGLFFVSVVAGRLTFETASENGHPNHPNHESNENRENPNPDNRNRRIFRQPFGPMHVYNFAFNAIAFTVFAMGLRVMERNAQIEKRQKELEKEKLNSELAFLKNQISPHFFFNTMNNIYSLISINKMPYLSFPG
jgi:two-component system LytT family sensor kinase